jgi:hypothetical protein
MQRKLKLSLVLPIVQVSITAILNFWANRVDWMRFGGYRGHPPIHFVNLDFFIINARLVWRGVNAPTFPFSALSGRADFWNWAFGIYGLIYLGAVAFLWYLVGRFFDRRRGVASSSDCEISAPNRIVTVLLMVWGVFLLAFSVLEIYAFLPSFPNTTLLWNLPSLLLERHYELLTWLMFLAWSVTLIVIHARSLVRGKRSRS